MPTFEVRGSVRHRSSETYQSAAPWLQAHGSRLLSGIPETHGPESCVRQTHAGSAPVTTVARRAEHLILVASRAPTRARSTRKSGRQHAGRPRGGPLTRPLQPRLGRPWRRQRAWRWRPSWRDQLRVPGQLAVGYGNATRSRTRPRLPPRVLGSFLKDVPCACCCSRCQAPSSTRRPSACGMATARSPASRATSTRTTRWPSPGRRRLRAHPCHRGLDGRRWRGCRRARCRTCRQGRAGCRFRCPIVPKRSLDRRDGSRYPGSGPGCSRDETGC